MIAENQREHQARAVENAAPIPWAKRLGGPGTGFFAPEPRRDHVLRDRPSGLSVGPVRTRAQKPYASGISSQYAPVARITIAASSTTPATTRAAFSLTGFGKENSSLHEFHVRTRGVSQIRFTRCRESGSAELAVQPRCDRRGLHLRPANLASRTLANYLDECSIAIA